MLTFAFLIASENIAILGLLVGVCTLLVPILFQLTKIAKWRGHLEEKVEINEKNIETMRKETKDSRAQIYEKIDRKAAGGREAIGHLEEKLVEKLDAMDARFIERFDRTREEMTRVKVNMAKLTGCLSSKGIDTDILDD